MGAVAEGVALVSHMPIPTIVIVLLSIVAILALGIFAVKYLNIMSLGPVKREHDNSMAMFNMGEEIREKQVWLRKQLWTDTGGIRRTIRSAFAEFNACVAVRVTLYQTILLPLVESLIENDFLREFLPANFSAYRDRLLRILKDEYMSIVDFTKGGCEQSMLPEYGVIAAQMGAILDDWLRIIAHKMLIHCEEKDKIYQNYRGIFDSRKDAFRVEIVDKFIEKNDNSSAAFKVVIDNHGSLGGEDIRYQAPEPGGAPSAAHNAPTGSGYEGEYGGEV